MSVRRSESPTRYRGKSSVCFFKELPDHLGRMALYKVNSGCREQEVCRLEWDWEVQIPEIGTSVFLIPNGFGGRRKHSGVKNGEDLVVLNDVAKSVIEEQRDAMTILRRKTG